MGAGASTTSLPESTRQQVWQKDYRLRGVWTFLLKEQVQCACEGLKWCYREDPTQQGESNAVAGVHSKWVGKGQLILAMARPWQSTIDQHGLVEKFQAENIGMILNLQEVGEHANCGPGVLPRSGFSYDPESFMRGGIGYYNLCWRDMDVPAVSFALNIAQIMSYVVLEEKKRAAVHCHAGLGRTGLAIACFFVFSGIDAAILAVRKDRTGALQTK
eukprot:CAMPEP_0175038730 /NCGR_PEP_ID=MMETSP0052_2-20121109/42_1 /TAXON_ID=51329 ORGANISM="Polytomella parva, Strain SAG 63-3" /NCGR_SAMPLE_ID=MMETSP0052_2 /ASSEMBLY_ACC=CAM_ASM_000194 /LENGTH=215 /DNA_ID=CAMNT_0016300207 /DNA_START=83 /DNA_END=727 /DNA_ORIENTATION=-